MIKVKSISQQEDFEALKKGDIVIVEWRRDMFVDNKTTRFAAYTIVENKHRANEIILQTRHNVYFNYLMFLEPEKHGVSNCKSIILVQQAN